MSRIILLLSIVLGLTSPAHAWESAPVTTSRTAATLIAEADSAAAGQPVRVALRLRMKPGWHTYWRNPGEAGVPVELSFSLADGATAGPIDWPAPDRMLEGQITTYGFTGEVVLPVAVTSPAGVGGVNGEVKANWLVCKDICVPEEAVFRVALPPGPGGAPAQAALFQAHDRAVPRASPWAATIAPDGTLFLDAVDLTPAAVAEARFIPDEPGQVADSAPQTLSFRERGLALGLHLARGFTGESGLRGVLTMRDAAGQRTDIAVRAAPGIPPAAGISLIQAVIFAFLGGAILNLMPCVFPILAMKAIGFASGAAHCRARAHGLSYTAGIMVTFVGVAFALLAARSAGGAAGWGFQFASPVFVAGMAWLLFVVGLNLSGVFRVGGGFVGAGGSLAGLGGHTGSFFTGALAVLVATPCTAPFMAAAVATGLAATPSVTVLIFACMGLGLASPYLALSAIPGLGRRFPRPGAWMEILRQALAFPMYGAAVWLLWVVSQQAGTMGVLETAAGFVLLGFAAWLMGTTQDMSARGQRIGWIGAATALAVAIGVLAGIGTPPAVARDNETFTPARLAALRAEGRPVFVNVTAAWCVSCLVNERVALGTSAVRAAFASKGIVYLKGDWTSQDPALTAFLRAQGRDGVPLYLYYAAHAGMPTVLPQLLTESTVLAVLESGA